MAPQTANNWVDSVKDSLNVETIKQKVWDMRGILTGMFVGFGIGFIAGYLLKRYAHLLAIIIGILIGIVILNRLELVDLSINQDKLRSFFGIEYGATDGDMVQMLWTWIKTNILIVLSFAGGCAFGLRVG
ncbi:hypothetical protein Noda2021_07940 [Candidatus Dependentiae bacterium Noda2021]|nr:hypothetical protein Noda2021_07940 [Candidatus Dependentiae bacterium Noda2021]